MAGISEKYKVKNDEIAEPKLYLDRNVEKFQLSNGKHAWIITSNSYVKGAIYNMQRLLAEDSRSLNNGKRHHKGPLPHGHKPDLDTTDK